MNKSLKIRLSFVAAFLSLVVVGLLFWKAQMPEAVAQTARAAVSSPTNVKPRILASQVPAAVASAPASAASLKQTPTRRGTLPCVLTSKTPFDKPLRLVVEALGAKTVSLQARNALLVEADAATRARLKADSRFEDIVEFAPMAKIQPRLAALIEDGVKEIEVSILALEEADRASVIAMLEKEGGVMLTGCINEGDTIRAKIPSGAVAALAARGEVRWLETFERPKFMNDHAVDAPLMNVRTIWSAHGLTGRGQKISTSDSGIDTGNLETLHRDLRKNVKDIQVVDGCYTSDVNGHGTHTAGSIVGDGTESTNNPSAYSDGPIRGTAYEANLYAWFCSGTDGYVYTPTAMNQLYRNNGAWPTYIHSASWGSKERGQYTSKCVNHDRFVWENPEFLPVFSAGNEGYNYGVVAQSIGAPGSAKNVLTVGATQSSRTDHDGGWGNGNPEKTVYFSSRGPCQDGRTKPDIAAPGVGILSTRSHGVDYGYGIKDDFYAYDSGTSMSCPLTAGAVALVRQWLVEQKGFTDADGQRPTAALMKAVIMGGAKGASVPNNDQGWGRVDLEETLFPSNRAVKLVDRIPFAPGFETNIVIETTNAAPLDVQLVWVDYPGSATGSQSAPKLVNDLDLVVETVTDGQVLTRYGNGGESPDRLNNAESVRLAEATPTKYVITVSCPTILHDSKEGGAAALYIRGAFDPAATPEIPAFVRLRSQGKGFLSLDRALKAVTNDGETVEILLPNTLAKPVRLTNSCTIVSMNADPRATLVTRQGGATLTVADGAAVTLSNVVFAAGAAQPAVSVAAGATLKIAGTLGLGTVRTADAGGIDLCGALNQTAPGVAVDGPTCSALGDTFGTYSCDYPTASEFAKLIANAHDEDLGGVPDSASGLLKWGVVTVPVKDAKVVVGTGSGLSGYRTFAAALKAALGQDAEITIKQNVQHTNVVTLTHNLTLVSTNDESAVLSLATPTAGFIVPQGTGLGISNLVVDGAGVKLADCALKVTGGSLTLENGSTLRSLSNKYQYEGKPWGGAVVVTAGSVTMKSGSLIENCIAHEGAIGGGALYLGGKDATANLFGGTIAGCSAANGGAVYVWGNSTTGACVNIKGDFVAKANTKLVGVEPSNVFLCYNANLTIPDHLVPAESRRTIGLAFGRMNGKADKNAEGQTFTALQDGELVGAVEDTARHLFSDLDAELQGEYTSLDDPDRYGFKWAKIVVTPPTEPFAEASVWIARDADTKYYYRDLNEALADLSWDAPTYVFNVTDDILLTNDVEISKKVFLQRDPSYYFYPPIVFRTNDAMYKVLPGGSLSISNVSVWGASWYFYGDWGSDSVVGLISVRGGNLTLGEGADVGLVWGTASRASNAITVYDGGTLTMNPGAYIRDSYNVYSNAADATGCGGAILLDRATAYLRGGEIAYSAALRGGAICVANKSTLYVGGSCVVTNNTDLTGENLNNIVVSKNSELILDGPFTGVVSVNEGLSCDTNWFGTVSKDWAWDVDSLTNSAAHFIHDKRSVVGAAVTNGTGEAVLVWSDWLSKAGKFEKDGQVYRICLAPGQSVVVPKEFSIQPKTGADGRKVLALEGGVEGCWYTVYSTADLSQPFTVETSVQLKAGETFEFEIDASSASKFYKVVGEEGLK